MGTPSLGGRNGPASPSYTNLGVRSGDRTDDLAVVTLQLLPVWFPQGDQRSTYISRPTPEALYSHRAVFWEQPCSWPAIFRKAGVAILALQLGGLAEVISVVQQEPQRCRFAA
ncbi:uncharacterized protein LOC144145105 isoform X3 [Haemaphysalis longicornis]